MLRSLSMESAACASSDLETPSSSTSSPSISPTYDSASSSGLARTSTVRRVQPGLAATSAWSIDPRICDPKSSTTPRKRETAPTGPSFVLKYIVIDSTF